MAPRNTRDSNRPGGKPIPSSVDYDAIAAEVDLQPFEATWNGEKWFFAHVETMDSWEFDRATGDNDEIAIMALALGEERWQEFNAIPIPVGVLNKIKNDYMKHCGISVGESGRSGRS